MAGFLQRLARLPRAARREEVEGLLREALARLPREPVVAAVIARLEHGDLALTHYTFDEPEIADAGASLQFTYHLGRAGLAGDGDEEIRGSGIALIDDVGGVRFADVDAEILRPLADDEVDPAD